MLSDAAANQRRENEYRAEEHGWGRRPLTGEVAEARCLPA